jgi:hypothetical protein
VSGSNKKLKLDVDHNFAENDTSLTGSARLNLPINGCWPGIMHVQHRICKIQSAWRINHSFTKKCRRELTSFSAKWSHETGGVGLLKKQGRNQPRSLLCTAGGGTIGKKNDMEATALSRFHGIQVSKKNQLEGLND